MSTQPPSPAKHAPSRTVSQQEADDLVDFERSDGRPVFFLTMPEAKLLGIAGVGFFLDGTLFF